MKALARYKSQNGQVVGVLYSCPFGLYMYKIWICGRLEAYERNFSSYNSANCNFQSAIKGF